MRWKMFTRSHLIPDMLLCALLILNCIFVLKCHCLFVNTTLAHLKTECAYYDYAIVIPIWRYKNKRKYWKGPITTCLFRCTTAPSTHHECHSVTTTKVSHGAVQLCPSEPNRAYHVHRRVRRCTCLKATSVICYDMDTRTVKRISWNK
jgi:hypothetical protein